jgi:major vault protein
VEEDIIKLQEPIIIKEKIALKLKARDACDDINGVKRQAGEEWLVNTPGFYQLGVYEELVEQVEGFVITENVALRMTALKSFTDAYGKERKAGEEWLIDSSMTSVHICDVFEKVLSKIKLTVLEKSNYCYILNPVEGGQNQLGKKILVIGPRSFFLQPGEAIEGGIKEIDILSEDEALLLKASESFVDDKEEKHSAGDIWMVYGPRKYIPPVEVEVIERRDKIPLDSVEGIYIRDIKTGQVRSEIGKCYMLKPHEELWDMELSGLVENILLKEGNPPREKHKLVTYKCPFNTAVQVYNYKKKESRVSFGPNMVCLGPDEQFTVCYLSGSQPKKPGVVKTISILLGPTFSGDLVRVETSDHARLELKLSYNWIFEVDKNDPASAKKIFNVRDFIGDCCSVLASRIRGVVAGVPFSRFHKHSARTIRRALFGEDESGHIGKRFYFETNNLLVSNVDIQRVEPVVQKTKEMLQRSVTQAINITTQIQEQEARRHAEKMEQDAKGVLERQILSDNSIVEEARKALLGLQAESDSIKSSGQAVAEAKARAEAAEISAEAEVNLADLRSQANSCKETTIIEFINKKHEAEIAHEKKMNNLKITKAKELSEIESLKFQSIMGTIGQDTLVQISLVNSLVFKIL